MNQHLKAIQDFIRQNQQLTLQEKESLLKAAKDTDKELEIINFKLDRTEKVKRTTAILLEETIAELEQKRKAVEEQNHELEIESALERVRSVAMGMKKPEDMLDVCKTIAQQLELLHIKEVRNVQTAIFYDEKGFYTNYEYYAKHGKLLVTDTEYRNHPVAEKFANQMMKGVNEIFIHGFTGKEVKDWLAYQKGTNVFIDDYLETADSLNYYWYSLGPVALGCSTYIPLKEEEIELFKRFRNVFELAYRRYLDIQKAEAQAREAQIEAALERVRSRAMAMHTSKELKEVAREMRNQFSILGQKELETCAIHLWDESSETFEGWAALRSPDNKGEIIESESKLNIKGIGILEESFQKYIAGKKDYVLINDVARAKEFFNALKQVDPRAFAFLSETIKNKKPNDISAYWSVSDFPGGSLVMVTYNQPDENSRALLRRFANVFGLAYQRFTDLKKAEAQARESQIQLALERVRARTMAMQKSDELSETVYILFQQFRELGENPDQATIGVINEKEQVIEYWVTMYGNQMNKVFKFPVDEPNVTNKIYKAWKENKKSLVIDLKGKKLLEFMAYRAGKGGAAVNPDEKRRIINVAFFSKGLLNVQSNKERSEESIKLLERFAAVFEQTYTRFLDLQKAEAQAREAQIQLALERVRAKTMAMQKQNDLLSVLDLLVEQLVKLGVQLEVANFSNGIPARDWDLWIDVITDDNTIYNNYVHFPRIDHPYFHHVEKNIQTFKNSGKDLFKDVFSKKEKDSWQDYINTQTIYKDITPEEHKRIMYDKTGYTWSMIFLKDTWVSICRFNTIPFSDEEDALFRRFANAFGQAYTRFLDLQKAEAQAREAQIETVLEKIRSRSIAMQKSSELKEVIQVVYDQFVHLKINVEHTGFLIDYKESDDMHIWLADEHLAPSEVTIPFFDSIPNNSIKEAKEKGQDSFKYLLTLEEKNKFYRDLFVFVPGVPEETLQYYFNCAGLAGSGVLLDNIGLYIENFDGIPYTDEENKILMRFGKVFQQTYTRFLDLQKAEAQSRESQIQLALERVRARTMAMQKSDELLPTADLLFDQLKQLGAELQGVAFAICDKSSTMVQKWTSIGNFSHPYNIEPGEQRMYEAWKNQSGMYEEVYEGEKQKRYYELFMEIPEFRKGLQKFIDMGFPIPTWQKNYAVPFQHGYLLFITTKPFNETQVFLRFGKVFEQTYTRFLDLQKAEAQAREAEIQLALERVRAKSLAMHHTSELQEVVNIVAQQLHHINIDINGGVFITINSEVDKDTPLWGSAGAADYVQKIVVPFLNKPVYTALWDAIKKKNNFLAEEYSRKEKIEFFEHLFKHDPWIKLSPERKQELLSREGGYTRSVAVSNYTSIAIINHNGKKFSDDDNEILKRFGNVFEQSYTRFLDLQKAEAQAREAKVEAALEKVRSRTLAMQKSDELAETSAVLFQQLILLGIEPNRLYIAIIQNDTGDSEFWITDEDGSKVSTAYTANLNDNFSFRKMLDGWKKQQKSLIIDMQGKELEDYFKHLNSLNVPFKGGLAQKRRVQYIAYFSKGFIGMASPDEQPEETMRLLERFAAVFNLTFTRFNDLKIAEAHALKAEQDLIEIKAARKKAEDALMELQATQKQLIQSEKMASLGELTAGIAHEIQNPLNFVNNFSDVSNELLEEMKMELAKGNTDDALAIAEDVKQNLEKILHHGKRADGIVKGMLQHSRSSSGQKELTDINALADEYLRLSYHGLRAKDKSFNAKFETDFDPTIGKINVVPQDIGRVILNLINNAFYAVNEKAKLQSASGGYEPQVIVGTKRINGKVEISVKDNGPGIPQKVLDKIFQPFFTTKPTGQGTGLGLSLSYDIITKGHGGELKVETKEGEGSTFIIQLPANSVS